MLRHPEGLPTGQRAQVANTMEVNGLWSTAFSPDDRSLVFEGHKRNLVVWNTHDWDTYQQSIDSKRMWRWVPAQRNSILPD